MKNIILIFCLLLTLGVHAQTKVKESEVPKEVLLGLENTYLTYKVKAWFKTSGQFIADLVVDGQAGRSYFTSDGTWQYSSFPVVVQELPTLANTYFDNNYPGFRIKRTEYIEEMSGDNYYRVIISQKGIGQTEYELIFNTKGSLMKSNAPDPEIVKKEYLQRTNPESVNVEDKQYTPPTTSSDNEGTNTKDNKKGKKPKKGKNLDIDTPEAEADDKPTEEVKAAFIKRYPPARIKGEPTWGMREENHVGQFQNRSDVKLEVLYKPDGLLISTATILQKERYPRAIVKYLETKYRNEKYKIERIDRVDYDTKYKDPQTGQRPKSYFYVVISQKVKGQKEKKLTRMTFDNTYKFSGLIGAPQDKFDKNY